MTTRDDPVSLLEGLGFSRPEDSDPSPPDASLDEVRGRIRGALVERQGPWREKSWPARLWPTAIAALLGGWLLFVWPAGALDGRPLVAAAAVAGAIAVVLTVLAATLAPERPGFAERLALVGLAVAALALAIEGALAFFSDESSFTPAAAVKCGAMMLALIALPLTPLLFNLWRSRVPARPLHLAATATAAAAAGGVAMWRHCATSEPLHVLLSHVALPASVVLGLGMLLYVQTARRGG